MEGTGASITLGTTGVTLLATSIQSQGISWTSIEQTHLGTTDAKEFERGALYDPGTVVVNFQTEDDLSDLLGSDDDEEITITYPNSTSSTEVSQGFITDLDPATFEVDTLATGSMTIKRTGEITFNPDPA